MHVHYRLSRQPSSSLMRVAARSPYQALRARSPSATAR